jgi:hypothetical protein
MYSDVVLFFSCMFILVKTISFYLVRIIYCKRLSATNLQLEEHPLSAVNNHSIYSQPSPYPEAVFPISTLTTCPPTPGGDKGPLNI